METLITDIDRKLYGQTHLNNLVFIKHFLKWKNQSSENYEIGKSSKGKSMYKMQNRGDFTNVKEEFNI